MSFFYPNEAAVLGAARLGRRGIVPGSRPRGFALARDPWPARRTRRVENIDFHGVPRPSSPSPEGYVKTRYLLQSFPLSKMICGWISGSDKICTHMNRLRRSLAVVRNPRAVLWQIIMWATAAVLPAPPVLLVLAARGST